MRYRHREIDPVALWERYVEFPGGFKPDSGDTFSGLMQCPNPDHDTMKRHFQINLKQPTVHCFAQCGISGHFEHAIALIEGLYEKFNVQQAGDERERKRREYRARHAAQKIILKSAEGTARISRKAHAQKKRQRDTGPATPVSSDLLRYESFLPPVALEYLESRKISSASVSKWQIGWDADELRVVIPAFDADGHLKFLVKRATRPNDQPKYLYTEGFPKNSLLFGLDKIDRGVIKRDGLIVVEGSIDTIRFHQHGLANTVGILGTGISEQQCRLLARLNPPKVILFFDKDTAGIRNIEIAAARLKKYPMFVGRYPREKFDPSELTRREALRQVARVVPLSMFMKVNGLSVKRARKEIQVGYDQG